MLYKLERKIEKFAIRDLTIKLLICYIVGYIFMYFPGLENVLGYLTLDPYQIVHGQVWRLITWVVMPPSSSNLFFIIITLVFYYSIGSTMERLWGAARYNLYIFSGLLLTVISAFLTMGAVYIFRPELTMDVVVAYNFAAISQCFTIYYVNMSILLAFAATFPDNMVLLFFVIPVKMKWLGAIYGIWLAAEAFLSLRSGEYWLFFPVAASLINFALFYFLGGRGQHLRFSDIRRKELFRQSKEHVRENVRQMSPKMTPKGIARHKCAICGQTELTNPDLEFRFCSKCNGNYEYCQEHLFTHQHKT